jgi:hypothetical protein
MADSYLKALGLQTGTKKQQQQEAQTTQAAGVTMNIQGLADVAQVIQAIEGMAAALAQVMQAVNDLSQKQDASEQAIAALSGKLDEQSGLLKAQNDIAMAPIVPERDAEGKIISARKILQ